MVTQTRVIVSLHVPWLGSNSFSSFFQHTDPDYSCAYVVLYTRGDTEGYGLTFTLGRGTEIGECNSRNFLSYWQYSTQHPFKQENQFFGDDKFSLTVFCRCQILFLGRVLIVLSNFRTVGYMQIKFCDRNVNMIDNVTA